MRGLSLSGVLLAAQACSSTPIAVPSEARTQEVPASQPNKAETRTHARSDTKPTNAPPAAAPVSTAATEPRLKAGECWAPTVILPRRVSTPLEIVTQDAVNDIKVRPAVIQPEQRSRIVREGTQTYRVEPPVFKMVTEKILLREEIRRTVVEPATFETREEKIEIEAAHEALVPCRIPGQSSIGARPGQALCVKAMPARYKTLTRKILLKPETTREEIEPAIYREVSKWVVETPARTLPIELPEKTSPFTVQAIATPEQVDETQQPPTIANLNSTHFEGAASPTWRQTPCAGDLSPELIKQLQTALNKAGFPVGAVDGKLGDNTLRAVQSYQNKHGLASGALTLETMQHLGVLTSAKTQAH
ncbi:MAG: peptidoglycan-binding domain-containing protein [Halothiobacillaceae bacterium]|nr:peptidoglycan-binding domain-containing protein [Halothiobacillaceae bacterium]